MRGRKSYSREFKESAIELVHSGGRAAKAVAGELGICPENLRRWLRKEVAELRETNEILKKTMVTFAERKPR